MRGDGIARCAGLSVQRRHTRVGRPGGGGAGWRSAKRPGKRGRGMTGRRGCGRAGARERCGAGERTLPRGSPAWGAVIGGSPAGSLLLGRLSCTTTLHGAGADRWALVVLRGAWRACGATGARVVGAPSPSTQRRPAGGQRRVCGGLFALAPTGRRDNGVAGLRGLGRAGLRDLLLRRWAETRDLGSGITGLRETGTAGGRESINAGLLGSGGTGER